MFLMSRGEAWLTTALITLSLENEDTSVKVRGGVMSVAYPQRNLLS